MVTWRASLRAQCASDQTRRSSRRSADPSSCAARVVQGLRLNSCRRHLALEVYVNLKQVGRNVLLAICDCEILGRTLRQGKIVFHVKADFYKGGKGALGEAGWCF